MILTTEELAPILEAELSKRLGVAVEAIDWDNEHIRFDVPYLEILLDGLVRITLESDLSFFIKWPHEVDYSYQFDINWCDILPEGVE